MPVIAARLRAIALGVAGVGCLVGTLVSPMVFGAGPAGDLAGLAAAGAGLTLVIIGFVLALGSAPRPRSGLVGIRQGEWTWDGQRWVHDSEPRP